MADTVTSSKISPMWGITIEEEFGAAEGYVANTAAEQLPHWLARNLDDVAEGLLADLRAQYKEFAVLNNLNVPELSDRGKGNGTSLLEDFLDGVGSVPVLQFWKERRAS
jgi:hypothetical protein